MTRNLIANGSFEDGWQDWIPPGGGWTRQQIPHGWDLRLWQPGDVYRGEPIHGYPECVHKSSRQLPPNERPGADDALILDGDNVYKIFSSGGAFAARLSQTIAGLTPDEEVLVTVPIRCHRHYDETDPWGVEAALTVPAGAHIVNTNGLPNREWVELVCIGNADNDGNLTVSLTVSAKWRRPVDFFVDGIAATVESDTITTPAPEWGEPTYTVNLPVVLTPQRKPSDVWRWAAWPTHFKAIWQKYGSDGSEWDIDYKAFGQCYHCGVDIRSGNYGEIMAVNDGVIHSIKSDPKGLGLYIQLKHSERFWTVYGHLSRTAVNVGDAVAAAQVIGYSGWTGNTRGTEQHLHIGQVDWHAGDKCCYSKYVDPEPFYRHLLDGAQPPQNGPISHEYNLWDYIIGDGRAYRVRGNLGGDEVFHSVERLGKAYQVKNSQWEQFWHFGGEIYRGVDTSPGDARYYRHSTPTTPDGAPWVPLVMSVGQSYVTSKRVQFYFKHDCSPDPRNSGDVVDTIRFVEHLDEWTSPPGYRVEDVIVLRWEEGGESYWYARDYGLVGWGDFGGARWSAIVEDVDAGMPMERIHCL